ncbi:MAG: L,D-transpeptidase family protein [Candidatus Omnitrophica bacterium]|nr:L,D-transpeptidase family protein [Candidatus Omnitrophota bacterium]
MKNRFLIIVIILLASLGLFFLPRFIKKGYSPDKTKSKSREQMLESTNVDSYLKEAGTFVERGSLLEAREIYQRLMVMPLSSKQLGIVQNKLENLNIKILFSGINIKQSQIYEVKSGDVLVNIAKKFNTTVDSIVKSNNIKENIIYPGMKLRILKGKFSILVDKSQNILMLKFNDEVVKTYTVSTGDNNSTPIGTYKIINKLVDPVWYKEGKAIPTSSPENILGSRWLGFDLPKYGIHGTTSPEDIGEQITGGCVRMRNEEVEELFSLVPPGTKVTIVD